MGNKSNAPCASKENRGSSPSAKGTKSSKSQRKSSSKSPSKVKFGRKATIPQSKLDRVKVTKSLNLEKSKLSSIPSNLFSIDNLEIVNLNDNAIKHIPEEAIPPFGGDEEKKSDVSPSKKGRKQKGKYKGIKVLRMNNNRLSVLPLSFINLQNVQTLQIEGNHFEFFPSIIFQLPRLKEVSMKKNRIQIIECSLDLVEGVKKLTSMDLSYNQLMVLPDEFCHLRSLEVCNLEYNQLGTLPAEWKGMKALHIINLKGNRLEDIPKSLFLETNVVRIDIEENPVHTKKKYVHLEGFDEFSERHKKHWDKGDFMGADRTHHTI